MKKLSDIYNDNDKLKQNKTIIDIEEDKLQKHRIVDRTANYLVSKLGSPESREHYCKIAYKLPKGTIDRLSTRALEKGRNPAKLFIFLSKIEISRIERSK